MIGLGTGMKDVGEFNRRAAVALRGVTFVPGTWAKTFTADMIRHIDAGVTLTSREQQALYDVVHRFRRQITDHAVLEYAAVRAKGAD